MGTIISFAGVSYTIPAEGDSNWGTTLSNYFIALSTGTLQRSGGSFTLTAELDFGNAYGLKGAYYKSSAANPSSAGILRLGNNESIGWRNAGNSADYLLKVNASNEFQFNGTKILLSGSVVNADIDAAAAIAYSKLNLSGSIVNADVNASAAIAYSKLNLATSIVNADISGSAAIAYSKLNLSTSIVNADINASAAIALSKLAATTASRALVSDASGFVSASSVTDTELGYVSGVTSAIQTQLNAKAPSASPTLTTPSTDVVTLDGQASAPTAPSSGYYKMYVKDDTSKLTIMDSAGNETSVGAGGGGINLITNGDAEGGTTGWATYADAASSRPVDGDSGSANITWTANSSSPLYGTKSFWFTKDAANRQGQGASYTFSVQPAHRAKVLNISFDYIVSSGTFVAGTSSTDSDIIVYIYDVTNGQLIEPSSIKLLSNSSSIADRFNATFQTSATGTSYRLILHCASTSASAYVVKFDNIQVSPSEYVYGTPITDWQSYTPTYTGFGTVSGSEVYWRRVGANVEIKGRFASGTSTATEARMTLPSGFTSASTSIIPSITVAGLGVLSINSATTSTILIEPSVQYVTFGAQGASNQGLTKLNGSSFLSSGNVLTFTASIPCAGLSASVQMSDQQDTRVVDFVGYVPSNQALTGNTTNITLTANKDSHGAWNGSQFTVPVAGDYIISGLINYTTSSNHSLFVYKNGSQTQQAGVCNSTANITFSTLVPDLKVGDVISLRDNATITTSANPDSRIFISRVAGPNQIAATELIAASYYLSASGTYSTTAPINFDTKEYDSHGSLVTTGVNWKFTPPAAGLYSVGGSIDLTSGASVILYKNGSAYKRVGYDFASSDASYYGTVRLAVGDYIDIRPSASVTVNGSGTLAASPTNINIIRVGL